MKIILVYATPATPPNRTCPKNANVQCYNREVDISELANDSDDEDYGDDDSNGSGLPPFLRKLIMEKASDVDRVPYRPLMNPFGTGDGIWISTCCLLNGIRLSFYSFHAKTW